MVSRARRFEVRFHEFSWLQPDITIRLHGGRLCLTSDVYVGGVCLDLHGDRRLEDNFFDLFPGEPYSLPWEETAPLPQLRYLNAYFT